MLPSDTGDCGTSTRFSLTPSDGSAELNHWTEAWGGVRGWGEGEGEGWGWGEVSGVEIRGKG